MSAIDQRVARLENAAGRGPRRCFIVAPEPCKTGEEWLSQVNQRREGKGHYELGPIPAKGFVIRKYWVPDP